MELQKLRAQLETTTRGHKLLKDKQDEFIHIFIPIIHEYKTLRIEVEKHLARVLENYRFACVKMTKEQINIQISSGQVEQMLVAGNEKIMGVSIPALSFTQKATTPSYDLLATTSAFDTLLLEINTLFAQLIELASLETKVQILVKEIEKSKRRVNAIENIVIKEINEQIRDIRMKLTDLERSNTIRMLKSKEMIINKKINNK